MTPETITASAHDIATAERALADAELARKAAADDAVGDPTNKKLIAALKEKREHVATCEDILNSAREKERAARAEQAGRVRTAAERRADELAAGLAPKRIAERLAPTIESLRAARRACIAAKEFKDRLLAEQQEALAELRKLATEHGLDLAELRRRHGLSTGYSGDVAGTSGEEIVIMAQYALSADRRKDGHDHGPLVRWLSTHHHG